ncbi:HPC2-domain-containing protein [Echria macrotheca]|uniref:HPC2-domain-containing protein n=1 Tax=Echria macrotheca TaxID=438768 RepID=A0AAJ0BFX2_9PEZI|nr:HPC2-domain-containing protein [Echria macrotheca]
MPAQYSSSPTSLSSPPSALSEPGSPSRFLNAGRANIEMDEIIVDPGSAPRFGIMQQMQQPPPQPDVPLTAAGLPRKKPGRKPGSTVKPKPPVDGTAAGAEQPKQRRPRKPKDPNAPPIQRKRKVPPTDADGQSEDISVLSASGSAAGAQPKIRELTSMRMSLDAPRPAAPEPSHAPMAPKRDSMPASMLNILNDEPPPKPQPAPPARQMFDPVRGNYDPIRESMMSRDPYGTGPLGSPRAPTQLTNRASASPSITSLVDPQPSNNIISPSASHTSYHNNTAQPRFQESTSMPPSPSHPARSAVQAITKPTIVEARRPPPPPPAPKPEPAKTSSFTSMSTIPASAAAALSTAQAPVQSKKIAAVQQQARETHKKASSSSSSPRINGSKDSLPPIPGSERSILDFGKANPGEEISAPSIVLHIPLNGEPNKYVNFMRMAEETYGWDALHPRLAANRERKARIAAASAALEKEKNGSGRDSGDEMEEDLQSDADNSNVEMGGVGGGANGATSGADGAPAKPARKKRNFKEDEYDKDDDFVDDSELLWEEQAAASRDGFFVYSGPLIPEVPKPAASDAPPRRGRGGGRGSRGGGRGGTRGEGTGRGRGGGPGSRGGVVRKPRITKLEKEQRDKEKAERERVAQMASKAAAGPTSSPHQGVVPPPQNTAA